jgi:homoserine kinase
MNAGASATAFAPASIGNVGVGFDMLGLAIDGVGDRVTARRAGNAGVRLSVVYATDGSPHRDLSSDPDTNTASIAARALWRHARQGQGLELVVRKGVPLQSGMGSSAASAVAAVVATNALLDEPLSTLELLPFALQGEAFASGSTHADNVAPSLLGGLVLSPPALLPRAVPLSPPAGVSSVLLHPELSINTAESRRKLARQYTMEQWLAQQGYLAAFVAACEHNDYELMRASLCDVIVEPQRAASVPCFAAVKHAALAAGAFGCSLSGSGPSLFALAEDAAAAEVAAAMARVCRSAGIACQWWVSPMNSPGARIESGT